MEISQNNWRTEEDVLAQESTGHTKSPDIFALAPRGSVDVRWWPVGSEIGLVSFRADSWFHQELNWQLINRWVSKKYQKTFKNVCYSFKEPKVTYVDVFFGWSVV